MNVVNEEIRVLREMISFKKMQLHDSELKNPEKVEEDIKILQEELELVLNESGVFNE